MRRISLATIASVALVVSASAQSDPMPTYRVQAWPAGLATLPCTAFNREADGSWAVQGTVIVELTKTKMTGVDFKGAEETRMIELRCGRR
jgi:hypothetical protein